METILERLGLSTEIVDEQTIEETAELFAQHNIVLPTFKQLADPKNIGPEIREKLKDVDPDAADPLNLFRVHWYNSRDRKSIVDVPEYLVFGKEFTGIDTPIVVLLGSLMPMIECHKVLAAYACLAPRVISGAFNPKKHQAVWPSTGNYCRGGVAISRLMDSRGVAILPEGMSQERFNWLNKWCLNPKEDIIATYGSESNVKEIYDKCNELAELDEYFIFNQFAEFNNHLAHYFVTGAAFEAVFEDYKKSNPNAKLKAFVSASGSAGTIATGDYLKDTYGSKTVAVEALECPTLLYNGYGDHNIQGIGDKHVPLVHNVMNSDFACAISDKVSNQLYTLFNTEAGREYLKTRRGVTDQQLDDLQYLGLSSVANIMSGVKTAKYLNLGKDDVIITVATDGARMYSSEKELCLKEDYNNTFELIDAAETFALRALGTTTDNFVELTLRDRERIFNLGYFTWCEQQGVDVEAFSARKDLATWKAMHKYVPEWDKMIEAFNKRVADK